jgi:hypothetical protein
LEGGSDGTALSRRAGGSEQYNREEAKPEDEYLSTKGMKVQRAEDMSSEQHEFLLTKKSTATGGGKPDVSPRRFCSGRWRLRERRLALADVGLGVTEGHINRIGA